MVTIFNLVTTCPSANLTTVSPDSEQLSNHYLSLPVPKRNHRYMHYLLARAFRHITMLNEEAIKRLMTNYFIVN
jgi:hypothetical protein